MTTFTHRLALVLICFIFSVTCNAKDLGVFGAVYDIAEKDALKEIEERAAKADLKHILSKDELTKKLKNYTPEDLKTVKDLPPAKKERTFLVDMTYTSSRTSPTRKAMSSTLKGHAFNPLNYITYPDDPRYPERQDLQPNRLVQKFRSIAGT